MIDKSIRDIANKAESDIELLELNVSKVKEGLTNILKNFFHVGYLLNVIQESKNFKAKNYKTFLDFSKSEFGLSKDQTYRMINIYKKFSNDDKYLSYSFSQLTEMLTLPVTKLNDVNSDMTVKDIRAIKKSKEKVHSNVKNEVFENIDIAKNQITVEDVLNCDNDNITLSDVNSKEFLVNNNLYVLTDRQVSILLDIQGIYFSDYLNSKKSWSQNKKDSVLNEICDIRKILEREE